MCLRVVDDSGDVYITATIEAGGNSSIATVKCDALGSQLWQTGYDGRGWSEYPIDIDVAPSGAVYVLSESSLPGGSEATSYWTLIKYQDLTVSSVDISEGTPHEYVLGQNYPNPFNPSTVIPFQLLSAGRVRLAVVDLLGREVRLLVDEQREAGSHTVAFDASELASGVYLYRLMSGGVTQTKKMLLLR